MAPLPAMTLQEGKVLEFSEDISTRSVFYDKQKYEDITALIQENPELKSNPLVVAISINFISRGTEFRVIDDVQKYQQQFLADSRKESEDTYPADLPRRKTWGDFNVSQIETPRWEGPQLIFFAEREVTRVPYKVVFSPGEGHRRARIGYSVVK